MLLVSTAGARVLFVTCAQGRPGYAGCLGQGEVALRYTGGRPPGAGKFAISMGNAQEGVWLLVISLSYPRQTLSNI